MRQLSGHDAGFLYTDTTQANANVSLLHIHDQSTAPGGVVRFKSILAHIERRLSGSPLFRQRLQRVPLGLDHPYWVDDEQFDLEYHVRHIALPKPGDWRQFCIQVSRIHARALDLDRPLWEAYVIEGLDSFLDLPGGSFALLLKTHLAAIDLHRLADLTALLYDTSATPPAPAPPEPWFADSAPGPLGRLGLVGRGLVHSASAPMRLARPLVRAATSLAPAAVAMASEMLLRPENLPVTRFNSEVSPHRVFETRRFTEAEFEAIRALVRGATVDEAVLAVCGGALRRYLDALGELPEGHSLAAILPEAVPGAAPAPGGVAAGPAAAAAAALRWRHVHLGTHIADAVQRLAAIQAETHAAPDAVARVLGSRALTYDATAGLDITPPTPVVDRGISRPLDVTDFVANTFSRVQGVGINFDGELNAVKGDSTYLFDRTLRLQGILQSRPSVGGLDLHPLNTGANSAPLRTRLAFVASSEPVIDVFDTYCYRKIASVPIRDPIIGPVRATVRPNGQLVLVGATIRGVTVVALPDNFTTTCQ